MPVLNRRIFVSIEQSSRQLFTRFDQATARRA
jgi:hypothetical protein